MSDRKKPSGGLHGVEAPLEAGILQMTFQFSEVCSNTRTNISIGSDSRDAFELSIFLR